MTKAKTATKAKATPVSMDIGQVIEKVFNNVIDEKTRRLMNLLEYRIKRAKVPTTFLFHIDFKSKQFGYVRTYRIRPMSQVAVVTKRLAPMFELNKLTAGKTKEDVEKAIVKLLNNASKLSGIDLKLVR